MEGLYPLQGYVWSCQSLFFSLSCVVCCVYFFSLVFLFFHMKNSFLKIISVVLGGGQMTLCLPTPGTAQYISNISCSYC